MFLVAALTPIWEMVHLLSSMPFTASATATTATAAATASSSTEQATVEPYCTSVPDTTSGRGNGLQSKTSL